MKSCEGAIGHGTSSSNSRVFDCEGHTLALQEYSWESLPLGSKISQKLHSLPQRGSDQIHLITMIWS